MPILKNTINLKDKANGGFSAADFSRAEKPPRRTMNAKNSRQEGIDEVFDERGQDAENKNLKKINRPAKNNIAGFYKNLIILLLLAAAVAGIYWLIFKKDNAGGAPAAETGELRWHAVKLVNGEIFYGQISDTGADPIVAENVYYNYDQAKDEALAAGEAASLRLVKKGKETYGPEGTMDIVRAQVLYMEPLKEGSKVLEAIIKNEGK